MNILAKPNLRYGELGACMVSSPILVIITQYFTNCSAENYWSGVQVIYKL
jgi:hypothetical protein